VSSWGTLLQAVDRGRNSCYAHPAAPVAVFV